MISARYTSRRGRVTGMGIHLTAVVVAEAVSWLCKACVKIVGTELTTPCPTW